MLWEGVHSGKITTWKKTQTGTLRMMVIGALVPMDVHKDFKTTTWIL
jgi:hypothetical protein